MKDGEKCRHVLREEHRLIESIILVFTDLIKKLETGRVQDRHRVWEIAQSFKTYAEQCHHAKEDFLLSMLRVRGGALGEYPFDTFYQEHQQIQQLLTNLAHASYESLQAFHGRPDSLVHSLRELVDFYPGHMWKADHLLFPLADKLLLHSDQQVLIQQFDWIESVAGGSISEQLRAMVAEYRPDALPAA